MKKCQHRIVYALAVCCLFVCVAGADIRLPAVFGDHMVLQQKSKVSVWGWAEPGEKIEVKGSWQWLSKAKTHADKDGKWQVKIKTPKADNHAVTLTIKGNNEIILNDILIGEVWICSGQSNMEMGETMVNNAAEEDSSLFNKAELPASSFRTDDWPLE